MIDLHDMHSTVEGLSRALNSLPGHDAQKRMSPIPRKDAGGGAPGLARAGATIILLYPENNVPHLVLTKRSRYVEHHKGQISLPGGMVEPGETLEQAAVREAEEEIGVDPERVTLLGPLSALYIPVSGFMMHPFVATLPGPSPWVLQEREVEAVLTPPLHALADPRNHRTEEREILGNKRDVPYFWVAGEQVWGATAMVLAEFMHLVGVTPEPGETV